VGAGHAGCEAALAAARAGASTLLLTINLDTIAWMPCNPSIGGQGKGQLVREIDALGGEMGRAADETAILARMLNTRKGLAVQSLRVQSDKFLYSRRFRSAVMDCPNLHTAQGTVTELLLDGNRVHGVHTAAGDFHRAAAVILAPGTFLRGIIHIGSLSFPAGRAGEPPADALGDFLNQAKFPLRRFKTGTPPRADVRSLSFADLEAQHHEPDAPPFSLWSKFPSQVGPRSCYLTHTNAETHAIIARNFSQSALFSGRIQGTGPRYCPSIEDKVRKFPDKTAHKVFLEPEGADSFEIYLQGLSTSLPEDVQEAYVHSMKGLEQARITRPGYAIEYDIVDPAFLDPTLGFRGIPGLFFAGQVNGTSGYEEAGAQGLLAGANAAAFSLGKPLTILPPDTSYTGLMIEEITRQGVTEPYRIFTSRSLHRLHLRMSNAEERLLPLGTAAGLVSPDRARLLEQRQCRIDEMIRRFEETSLSAALLQETFRNRPELHFAGGAPAAQVLKRPEIRMHELLGLVSADPSALPDSLAAMEVEARIKYAGYLEQQTRDRSSLAHFQDTPIPEALLSDLPAGLSFESRRRIEAVRPARFRDLAAIPGIRGADLLVILAQLRRMETAP
jgi:tRNA uridine 5-carboxymethylaminomethyl modification enzyme